MECHLPKIIFIVGPTAVGKSAVALKLAQKIQGEIISCDSMQVYKEINIASNKPSEREQSLIKHHLINVVSVSEDFNVALFNQLTLDAIKEIHQRKYIPIIVGGSGMYMQVVLDGIFEGGGKDEALRKKLWAIAEGGGKQSLYDRLIKEDSKAAKKIHPNDIKKIIRALEVCQVAKKPVTEIQKNRQGIWGEYDIKIFALNRERQELYERINRRVDQMFTEGLLEEIKALSKDKLSVTVKGLIGIKEGLAVLAGEYDVERAKYLMKRNTRHFAKRQLTWFRKDKRLEWIMINEKDTAEDIAERMRIRGNKTNRSDH